jgi:hypothetical protein
MLDEYSIHLIYSLSKELRRLDNGMRSALQPQWELVELVLEEDWDTDLSPEHDFVDPESAEYWSWYCPACGFEEVSYTYTAPIAKADCARCGRQFTR